MKRVLGFLKRETVLTVSLVLAAASLLLVPPDAGYRAYVSWSVLGLLFCLMAAVAGLRQAGVFARLAASLTRLTRDGRRLSLLLTGVCFVLSALVTNDVVLITFVPFTVALLGTEHRDRLIAAVVLETVAANLGSLLTPMGNPQNLLIYERYALEVGEFFSLSLPLWGLCLAATLGTALLLLRGGGAPVEMPTQVPVERAAAVRAGLLLLLCILTVFQLIPWYVCLGVTAAALAIFDRRLFLRVDWSLLATFVCFFIFVGNLGRVEAVRALTERLLAGRVTLVSALVSQVVSNVPAAAMLCAFTQDWRGLFLGVNVGGLGTILASMASLISFRLYAAAPGAAKGRYFAVFTAVNAALLILLLGLTALLWRA